MPGQPWGVNTLSSSPSSSSLQGQPPTTGMGQLQSLFKGVVENHKCPEIAGASGPCLSKGGSGSQVRKTGLLSETGCAVVSANYVRCPIKWAPSGLEWSKALARGDSDPCCVAPSCTNKAVYCALGGCDDLCVSHSLTRQVELESHVSEAEWKLLGGPKHHARTRRCGFLGCDNIVCYCCEREDAAMCRRHAPSYVESNLAHLPEDQRVLAREAVPTALPGRHSLRSKAVRDEGVADDDDVSYTTCSKIFKNFPSRSRTISEFEKITDLCTESAQTIRAVHDRDPVRSKQRLDNLRALEDEREKDASVFKAITEGHAGWAQLSPLAKLRVLEDKQIRAPAGVKAMKFMRKTLSTHALHVGGSTASGKTHQMCLWALKGFVPIRQGGKVVFFL
jgi:hypothetical protein